MSQAQIETQHDSKPPAAEQKRGHGRMIGLFVVSFVVFLVIGVYVVVQRLSERRVLAEQTERMAVPTVAVIHAASVGATTDLILPATLQAYTESPIYARTNGYLKKWYKDIGSHVEKGELLAEIDTPEVDQQLAQAQADLATAQANVNLSSVTATRYQELLKTDSVSKQEADNANGDYAAKKAVVQSAEANVKRLEDLESFKRVYAPFSGVITHRNVDIGNLINAGNGGAMVREMFDLAETNPLRVFVNVPQSFAPSIHRGLKACLDMTEFPGRTFCGEVARTSDSIDPGTRTLNTEVDVPNREGTLLPGAYAQVHFQGNVTGTEVVLPVTTLLFRPEGTLAATVENGQIHLKKLHIGRDFGNTVEILEGVTLEDSVVVNPPDSLEEGEKVNAKPKAEGGTAPARSGQQGSQGSK